MLFIIRTKCLVEVKLFAIRTDERSWRRSSSWHQKTLVDRGKVTSIISTPCRWVFWEVERYEWKVKVKEKLDIEATPLQVKEEPHDNDLLESFPDQQSSSNNNPQVTYRLFPPSYLNNNDTNWSSSNKFNLIILVCRLKYFLIRCTLMYSLQLQKNNFLDYIIDFV